MVTHMSKSILLLSAAFLMILGPVAVSAQNFDTSGTSSLTGQYLFRYVNMFNDENGDITESCSLMGTITFDGNGKYSLSNTQLYDSLGTGGAGDCASLGGGTYGVQANGIAQLDNPLFPATLFGTFSAPVLTANSTEDGYYDMFIAVQAPTAAQSNSTLSGAYTVGSLELLNSSNGYNALTHQAYFTLNANGSGSISSITLTGSAENLSSNLLTQTVSGATYSLSGTAGGTLTIPNSNNSQLVSGTKVLYVSADGNYILGGATNSDDMIFGFRQSSSAPTNSSVSGTYFLSGMDADLSGDCLDSFDEADYCLDNFYGTINANGAGTLVWHERLDDPVAETQEAEPFTEDYTIASAVTIGSTGCNVPGCYYDSNLGLTTLSGNNGKAVMMIGAGAYFSFYVGIQAPSYTPTSTIWINPVGITNAANYTGITNAYAPGELVNIYGNFGVSTQVDSAIPIPTNLSGVQVTVNGFSAPVYLVSANQISALIPYEIATDNEGYIDNFVTFQVIVNGQSSNSVTLYADQSSPGLYTISQNGIGSGAILHANNTEVTSSSPAVPGETVSLYMNGLGTVTPTIQDGAAGPSNPLSYADEYNNETLYVGLNDEKDSEQSANITFAGAAPGIPGLYQVNFTIPSNTKVLGNGAVYLDFETLEGTSFLATINLSGFSHTTGVGAVPDIRRVAAGKRPKASATAALTKSHKRARALPERISEKLK
jgi:uncharacterized protein (TIGR03437 family)